MTRRNPTANQLRCAAFLRGLPIAALQACGVLAIQRGNLWGVAATAYAINWYWRKNVRGVEGGFDGWFAAGGACGSVLMVWLFR